MDAFLMLWWAWIVIGLLFAILELVAPGHIFLGFAVGAFIVGVLKAVGVEFGLFGNFLTFAVIALGSWLALRKIWGSPVTQVYNWDDDINDNSGKGNF